MNNQFLDRYKELLAQWSKLFCQYRVEQDRTKRNKLKKELEHIAPMLELSFALSGLHPIQKELDLAGQTLSE